MDIARDVAIIVLAVESIVIGGLLIFLIIQLQRLIRMLREEIKPVIDSTNETVSTVRGTTTFLSEHLVSPIIGATSFMAGIKRGAQVLTSKPGKRDVRAQPPPAGGEMDSTRAGSASDESNVE
jgi:hypothetical protein